MKIITIFNINIILSFKINTNLNYNFTGCLKYS